MEGKIIDSSSFLLTIERVVQIPTNLVLNFSSKKINRTIQKEFYFNALDRSYLLLKFHLYDIYRTLLHGENLSNFQDELYLDVLNEISCKVLLKSVISCRSIGEKYYDMPQNSQMIEVYYREFNMAFKNIQLPKKDDNSYRNIIQEVLSQGYITNKEAEYLKFRLTAIVSGVHVVWQILQKMFQECRVAGILPPISVSQQQPYIETNNAHFKVDLSYSQAQCLLSALQQNGYISTKTTADTFYYRMTGAGKNTTEKIVWIKTGKRRKHEISKSSLVYFLSLVANYKVDKTKQCTHIINNIFGLNLSSSTITNTTQCEFKNELDHLIGTILQS